MRIYFVGLLLFLLIRPGHIYARSEVQADTLQANAWYNEGAAHAKKRAFDSARYYLNKAANIFLRENCFDRYFNIVTQVCYSYNLERKFDRTLSYTDSIMSLHGDKLKDDFKSAIFINGTIAYANLYKSRFARAERYLIKTNAIMEQNAYTTDNNRLWLYYTFAQLYNRIGQNDLAISYLDKCQSIAEKHNNAEYLSLCYNLKGIIARRTGEYQRASSYYNQSLNLNKDKPEISKLQIFNNLGRLYHFLGRDSIALVWLDRGLNALWDYTDDYYSVESSLQNNKAEIYIDSRRFDVAQATLDQTLKRELEYFGKTTVGSAMTLYSFGDLELARGNYKEAENYYRKLLSIVRDVYGPRSVKLAQIYRDLGKSLIRQKKYEEGLNNFQKALQLVVPAFEPADVFSNPLVDGVIIEKLELLETLQSKSQALYAYFHDFKDTVYLNAALETNGLAMDLFNVIRENLYYGESQKVLTGLMKLLFEESISMQLTALEIADEHERGQHYQAIFNAIEGSKSYALLVAIQRSQMRGYSLLPDSISNIEMEYLARIGMYEKRINDLVVKQAVDSVRLDTLEQRLFTVRKNFEEFKDLLALQYPDYERSRYRNLTFNLEDMQNSLDNNEFLLTYFVGKERVFGMGINNEGVRVAELGGKEEIEKKVRDFISLTGTTDAAAYQQKAFVLHEMLLRPLLTGFEQKEYLIIIPDGILGYLPFDALVDELVEKPVFADLKYEILEHTITQHYLASLYLQPNSSDNIPEETFIGYAPDFEWDESQLLATRNADDPANEAYLTPLPYAKEEVKKISELVDGLAVLGEAATESQFKKNAGKYRYIHVASHSLVNQRDPLYSKLVFAPESEEETGEDGILHSYELYHMRLNGNVVALSACRTGTGTYQEGEGIISLARGFIHAGASGVLMSLWEVADRSTSEIMYHFYDELAKGKSRSEALRSAKLTYLDGADDLTANPYYWAGFNYLGSRENGSGNMPFVFGVLLLIALVFGGIVYARRTAS